MIELWSEVEWYGQGRLVAILNPSRPGRTEAHGAAALSVLTGEAPW